jgi:FkbM family methyltransferase
MCGMSAANGRKGNFFVKFKLSAWCAKLLGKSNPPAAFLSQAHGIIHVGGNAGQERFKYADRDLDVVWIEPISNVFANLQENLRAFPRQRAYRYLITDKTGQEYTFHISNNDAQSSSIFQLEKHKEMWPEIVYKDSINLTSTTLSSFAAKENLDLKIYDVLVLDTQGSELLVLNGALDILFYFRFVVVEVADFESYAGCCLLKDMEEFMDKHGFRSTERRALKSVRGIGTYYDVTYERNGAD